MTFGEKLKKLRTDKGLTQDELAAEIFVTRTAISKWESERGFPNIESLKSLAKYFSISLDELLSNEELLLIAENDSKEKQRTLRDLIFGLLDCGSLLLLFLPFFGQNSDGFVESVSLLALNQVEQYLKVIYMTFVIIISISGILTLTLQKYDNKLWTNSKNRISLLLSVLGVALYIIGQQPYAAIFVFIFLIIKVFILNKF